MAENSKKKDIILERIIITDPIANIKTANSGSCIGMLGIGAGESRTWYPCVENMKFVFLREGTYRIRMIDGKRWNVETVFQVYTYDWCDILIHPTTHYKKLTGCIAPGMEVTLDDSQVLLRSQEAHKEIIKILGPYKKFKEFELIVKNNPPGKGVMTKDKWVTINQKKWKEVKAEKLRLRVLKKQSSKPPTATNLDN